VSKECPIGLLLPDLSGLGRFMYLFLHYLLHQHNRLLKELCDIKAFEQR
jgi:hypothetical protein